MNYVQATRPEFHNGGNFFEHEVHIELRGEKSYQANSLKNDMTDFIIEHICDKHDGFRISSYLKYERAEGQYYTVLGTRVVTLKVRFIEKPHAMMFKLSYTM